jgi:glutamine---fructose-6-phosphate transaminase (isomerizing)
VSHRSVDLGGKLFKELFHASEQHLRVIAVATEGDEEIREKANHVIFVPSAPELLTAILEIVPLLLLAYHIAVRRGSDVDMPRNLAKSVTVE